VQAVEQNPGREAQAVAELIQAMKSGVRHSAGSAY
jgi:hypothetical protein